MNQSITNQGEILFCGYRRPMKPVHMVIDGRIFVNILFIFSFTQTVLWLNPLFCMRTIRINKMHHTMSKMGIP